MANISIQTPIDQPTGKVRLLGSIQECLKDDDFNVFRMVVAFVKAGPLLRLEKDFDDWISKGNKIEAIFGIDEKGTSVEALEFSLKKFEKVYIAHVQAGAFNPTFHPKIYHFEGNEKSRLYIGSNNLTVGGIESNSETNICLDFRHDEDEYLINKAHEIWDSTLTFSIELNKEILAQLVASGMVVSEKAMRTSRAVARKAAVDEQATASDDKVQFPLIKIIPPSALPKSSLTVSRTQADTQETTETVKTSDIARATTEGLVIQISPHHNGEVFLSKIAVDQNREFFEFPFNGRTTPKIEGNPSYPQRDPDPKVDMSVYDGDGNLVFEIENYDLNTVYYETKSEIRITVPQDVIQTTPPFSILVMSKSEEVDKDYYLDIYAPGSDKYDNYLDACNQTMPSGGNPQARQFGWL